MKRLFAALGLVGAFAGPAFAGTGVGKDGPADPLASVMWDTLRTELFGDAPIVFDDRVTVTAPSDAEDATAVPVLADASALGVVEEMVLISDLNPFPVVLRYHPKVASPVVGTRIRVQQATPVRAAARTPDGVWHIGGRLVDAAGGGCTAPPVTYAAKDWADHIGEVQARAWPPAGAEAATRLRLRVRHPMDNGLIAGIPSYFVERLSVVEPGGRELARLDVLEPVSENPVFTLDVRPAPGVRTVMLVGRDTQGGEIDAAIPLPWVQGALP